MLRARLDLRSSPIEEVGPGSNPPSNVEVSPSGLWHTPGKRDPQGFVGSNPTTSAMKNGLIAVLLGTPFVILAVVLYVFSGAFPPPFAPQANTLTASRFTWESFQEIREGDSVRVVRDKLGDPLSTRSVTGDYPLECWQYTRRNSAVFFRFQVPVAEVCLNAEGLVVATHVFRR